MRIFLTLICLTFLSAIPALALQDSLEIEVIDGKEFIKHRVQEKETLYSLSRKYNVPIYRIIEHNPPTEFGLEIGTIINVPVIKEAPVAEPKVETKVVVIAENRNTTEEQVFDPQPQKEDEVVKHKVETKQTLYSISKLYGVTVDQIREWNQLTTNALDIGQMLIIRRVEDEKLPEINMLRPTKDTHIVASGETLYSISRKYGVTLEALRTWNELVSNDISIGQELIVVESMPVEPTDTDTPISPTIEAPKDKERDSINRAVEATRDYEESTERINFEEVVESGVAEVIRGTDNTRKYLALHRTAKVGTILKVRNDMNNQEVFVRVLGKLPDNSANQNVLIKLSQAAYDRLGAIDAKFRVTISYIP